MNVHSELSKIISYAKTDLPNSREYSLVVTKLEEAKLWLVQADTILAAKSSQEAGVAMHSNPAKAAP